MCSNWNYFRKATHTNCFINHSFACSLTQSFIFAVLYMQARFRLQFSIFIYLWLLPNATHKFQFRFRAWINFKHIEMDVMFHLITLEVNALIDLNIIIYWWELNVNLMWMLWTEKLLFCISYVPMYWRKHLTDAKMCNLFQFSVIRP